MLNSFARGKVLLIADEAHNMGSYSLKKKLSLITYLRRIGLSATPERQFDESGNTAIQDFFGVKDGVYTYEYSMKEAIDKGVLCKYLYFPHVIELTDEEMDEYIVISEKIAKYFNYSKECFTKIDDILSKGDNADAYFYKILCSLEARNEEEFIEYADTFDNFELFEKALDCSDKDSAKRLTDMFVAGYKDCFDDGYYNSAIMFFLQLIKYDIDSRDEVISTMKSRIFELLSSGEDDELLIRLTDSYLLSVDPNDIDNYISECLGFAHSAHVNDKLAVAQHFMKKVKEIDEGNPEVTMFNLMLQTGSSSPDQLIDNICKIEDLNDIVSLIKNSSSDQASMCMQIFITSYRAT